MTTGGLSQFSCQRQWDCPLHAGGDCRLRFRRFHFPAISRKILFRPRSPVPNHFPHGPSDAIHQDARGGQRLHLRRLLRRTDAAAARRIGPPRVRPPFRHRRRRPDLDLPQPQGRRPDADVQRRRLRVRNVRQRHPLRGQVSFRPRTLPQGAAADRDRPRRAFAGTRTGRRTGPARPRRHGRADPPARAGAHDPAGRRGAARRSGRRCPVGRRRTRPSA